MKSAPPTECEACAAYDREEVTTDPFKWLGVEGHHHALIAEKDAEIERLRAALERAQDALLSATDGDQYSEHMDTLKQIDEALRK